MKNIAVSVNVYIFEIYIPISSKKKIIGILRAVMSITIYVI